MGKCTGNYPSLSHTCSQPWATSPSGIHGARAQPRWFLNNLTDFPVQKQPLGIAGCREFSWAQGSCAAKQVHLPSLQFLGISGCSFRLFLPQPYPSTRNGLQGSAQSFDVLTTSGFLQDFPCSSNRKKKKGMDGMKEGGQPASTPGAAYPKPFPAS